MFAWLATVLLAAHPAFASNGSSTVPGGLTLQKLVSIRSDRDSQLSLLNIALDAHGDPQGLEEVVGLTPTEQDTPSKEIRYFSVGDIDSEQGVVLDHDHNAVILKGTLDPISSTDTLTIHYLSNGLWGNYDSCDIIIQRAPGSHWELVNAYTQQPVQSIFVKTWSMGITTMQGICK
ncbi:MAG: hypothetical protein P4M08_08070 [Oligoflexia bacterium]|nr:hypothetical protein [Oligoflexia bacterium]